MQQHFRAIVTDKYKFKILAGDFVFMGLVFVERKVSREARPLMAIKIEYYSQITLPGDQTQRAANIICVHVHFVYLFSHHCLLFLQRETRSLL